MIKNEYKELQSNEILITCTKEKKEYMENKKTNATWSK